VLAREADGSPALTRVAYGKGTIYFLTIPVEMELANTPGAFHSDAAPPAWQLYRYLAEPFLAHRIARKDNPFIGITEHPRDDGSRVVTLINYSPTPQNARLTLAEGWRITERWYGAEAGQLPANDAVVFLIQKE
jgi:hypothetical protein